MYLLTNYMKYMTNECFPDVYGHYCFNIDYIAIATWLQGGNPMNPKCREW
uniref:Uncharacterized protein n=1 Tax=Anguilla anguilla TaxID=7936 RepID=A0A0E9PDF0_ANGAN